MFGQEDHHVSDASTKSQTRSSISTPAFANFLTLSDGASSGGQKRKRDGNTMDDLLKDTFVVKPYPSTTFIKPRSLQPLMLLPRSQLPLSSLDLTFSAKSLPQSRLYETHVKILELEERMGSQPMVLIARLEDTRAIYAVERESRGLYVLCQLGSWVDIQELKVAAVASQQEQSKALDGLGPTAQDVFTMPTATAESSKYSKKKRLAIEAIQSMVKRPSTCLNTESRPAGTEAHPNVVSQENEPITALEDAAPPTAAEIFDNVRTQYFEALYLSKASLAYFAKGPLSRARAAFHLDYDSTLDLNDHIAFLESLVMHSSLIDKKFRDGVPNCISLIDIQDESANEGDPTTSKSKKRKSNKKMKPGKNGLYPTEESLIRRWWGSHEDDADIGAPGMSKDEITKNRISQLRIRETQLQMIVILEVLALQPLASTIEDVGDGLPAPLPTSDKIDNKGKQTKSKKSDHLTMLIDVHIDRLCIWQSVALESVKAPLGESQNSKNLGDSTIQTKHADNILRDFCIEIIAPFFSARLPDRCAAINRKLGGPVVVSPPKPKLAKSSSFSSGPSRPGAATKRPIPVKPRRSLKRVLTDDRERRSMSQGPNRAISLMRSATMPIVPGMKREMSEVPSLSSIPAFETQNVQANRGGVLNSRRFSQREVDLSLLAPEINSKAKKQAAVEAELKEAISALKKPNRELAGKAMVETAEKRSASASHSRKSKKPIRSPFFQGIQISATPKANRQKNILAESQPQLPNLPRSIEREEVSTIPASSLPRIPASASHSSTIRKPLFHSIQATPTRKPTLNNSNQRGGFLSVNGNDMECASFPPSSPLHIRRSSKQLFFGKSTLDSEAGTVKGYSTGEGDESGVGVLETPVKKRSENILEYNHASVRGSDKENNGLETKDPEVNIYKSLGWDDGDDIDDLA